MDGNESRGPSALPDDIKDLPVADDLTEVEQLMHRQFGSKQEIIRLVSEHLVGSGGKRIRPLVCLLASRMLNPSGDEKCIVLATTIELIHTATLLHDDVIDRSRLRRGRTTANLIWSNEACILIGDYLYSRAFQLIASLECHEVSRNLSRATNVIASGEVAQYLNKSKMDVSEEAYMTVINEKTAILFEASCYNSAVLCGASSEATESLAAYGRHLGIAFQLTDDVLDYSAGRGQKAAGDDLAGGKPTLPIIHALAHASAADADAIRAAFECLSRESLPEVLAVLDKTGSLDYAREKARSHVEQACAHLDGMPSSSFRDALIRLARQTLEREGLAV